MQTTIYTCDICNKEAKKEDLICMTITTNSRYKGPYLAMKGGSKYLEICKECLEKKGFIIDIVSDEEREAKLKHNSVCMEDQIINILSDIGVQFEQ
jgi:hypothetical protein